MNYEKHNELWNYMNAFVDIRFTFLHLFLRYSVSILKYIQAQAKILNQERS